MADDNLDNLYEKIRKLIRPLKEDVEITKSKVSKVDVYQGVMSTEIRSIKDQQSVINEKLDNTATKEDIYRVEGQIEEVNKNVLQVLTYARNIEDERHKNEKRLKKIEAKVGLVN